MPTLRVRRLVRRPTQYVFEDKYRKKWTFMEKKKLLAGLKRSALCFICYVQGCRLGRDVSVLR